MTLCTQKWLVSKREKDMNKANFDNYQNAAKKGLIVCVIAATLLLCHGLITGANGTLKLSLVAVSGFWVLLILHFFVSARVKGKNGDGPE